MFEKIESLISFLLGWHQYRIKFIYKNKAGSVVFWYSHTVSFKYKRSVDDHRIIKKYGSNLYGKVKDKKYLLTNGTLEVEPTCYLGRFKSKGE